MTWALFIAGACIAIGSLGVRIKNGSSRDILMAVCGFAIGIIVGGALMVIAALLNFGWRP